MMERKIKPGDLDRKIYVSIPTITYDADTKYEDVAWGDDIELYASVIDMNASKEAVVNGGLIYDSIISVIIRYKEIYNNTAIRLKYNNQYYDVISNREVYGRKQWLTLKCKYGGKEL